MALSKPELNSVIRAHIAGDSAKLICMEQRLDYPSVEQAIKDYETEQADIRAAFRRIDGDIVVDARKTSGIALTDAQRVVQLYRETDLSSSDIAQHLKLKVTYVKQVIAQYDATV